MADYPRPDPAKLLEAAHRAYDAKLAKDARDPRLGEPPPPPPSRQRYAAMTPAERAVEDANREHRERYAAQAKAIEREQDEAAEKARGSLVPRARDDDDDFKRGVREHAERYEKVKAAHPSWGHDQISFEMARQDREREAAEVEYRAGKKIDPKGDYTGALAKDRSASLDRARNPKLGLQADGSYVPAKVHKTPEPRQKYGADDLRRDRERYQGLSIVFRNLAIDDPAASRHAFLEMERLRVKYGLVGDVAKAMIPKGIDALLGADREEEKYANDSAPAAGGADRSEDPGVMLAFQVPADLAEAIALPGGEPPDALHVTLVYLGRLSQAGQHLDKIRAAVKAITSASMPFSCRLAAPSVFPASESSDGRDVLHLPVENGAGAFRQVLVESLRAAGVRWSDSFPTFKAHITVGYLPPRTPRPELEADGELVLACDEVVLAIGDQMERFPLLGGGGGPDGKRAEKYAKLRGLAERYVARRERYITADKIDGYKSAFQPLIHVPDSEQTKRWKNAKPPSADFGGSIRPPGGPMLGDVFGPISRAAGSVNNVVNKGLRLAGQAAPAGSASRPAPTKAQGLRSEGPASPGSGSGPATPPAGAPTKAPRGPGGNGPGPASASASAPAPFSMAPPKPGEANYLGPRPTGPRSSAPTSASAAVPPSTKSNAGLPSQARADVTTDSDWGLGGGGDPPKPAPSMASGIPKAAPPAPAPPSAGSGLPSQGRADRTSDTGGSSMSSAVSPGRTATFATKTPKVAAAAYSDSDAPTTDAPGRFTLGSESKGRSRRQVLQGLAAKYTARRKAAILPGGGLNSIGGGESKSGLQPLAGSAGLKPVSDPKPAVSALPRQTRSQQDAASKGGPR